MNLQHYAMTEHPDKRTLITTGCYWFVAFFLLPIFLLYLTVGFHEESQVLSWVQFCYYAVNALCGFFIFKDHLIDSWLTFRIDTKKVIVTVLACLGIFIVILSVATLLGSFVPGLRVLANMEYAVPVTEIELLLMPADYARANPIPAMVSLVVFTPITVSCLLYGLGFAPACSVHPILGYVVLLAVLALHRALNYYTTGTIELENMMYAVQLPAHLLACVAYHRTDTVLAPILFHMLLNLLTCVMILL